MYALLTFAYGKSSVALFLVVHFMYYIKLGSRLKLPEIIKRAF